MITKGRTANLWIENDKIKIYASALPEDISATCYSFVENQKLVRVYAGTVFDQMVGTENGFKFKTFDEARKNAEFFVEKCKFIIATES